MTKHLAVALAALALPACMPRTYVASTRNPDLFEKAGQQLNVAGQGPEAQKAPEMYVKKSEIKLAPIEQPNETGSLFDAEDERNYLFTSAGPHMVGRYVTVALASNVKPEGPEGAAPAEAKPVDEIEKELLEALPELRPGQDQKTKLVKDLKMKITHRHPNGDVLAMMTRRSVNGDQANEITVTARIPHDRLMAGDQLTTADLLDVKLVESKEGELAERRSSGWEDEYSLRISGFDEAKSKVALELEDKRRKLEEAREGLRTRIKSFSEERKQVAKQREQLAQRAADFDQKEKDLKDQLEQTQKTVKSKDDEIKAQGERIAEKEQELAEKEQELEKEGKKEGKGK